MTNPTRHFVGLFYGNCCFIEMYKMGYARFNLLQFYCFCFGTALQMFVFRFRESGKFDQEIHWYFLSCSDVKNFIFSKLISRYWTFSFLRDIYIYRNEMFSDFLWLFSLNALLSSSQWLEVVIITCLKLTVKRKRKMMRKKMKNHPRDQPFWWVNRCWSVEENRLNFSGVKLIIKIQTFCVNEETWFLTL